VALSDAEFDARRAAGLFAFDWAAHGFRYAIGAEIDLWRKAGLVVVVSGSREHYAGFDPRPAGATFCAAASINAAAKSGGQCGRISEVSASRSTRSLRTI
jgi:ribose 1,5-bisphosphokinase PhnN